MSVLVLDTISLQPISLRVFAVAITNVRIRIRRHAHALGIVCILATLLHASISKHLLLPRSHLLLRHLLPALLTLVTHEFRTRVLQAPKP